MVHMYRSRVPRKNDAPQRSAAPSLRGSIRDSSRSTGPAEQQQAGLLAFAKVSSLRAEEPCRHAKSLRLKELPPALAAARVSPSPQRKQPHMDSSSVSPQTRRPQAAAPTGREPPSTLKSLQLALAEHLLKKERGLLGTAQARSRKKIVIKQRQQLSHRSFEAPTSPQRFRPASGLQLAQTLSAVKVRCGRKLGGRLAEDPGSKLQRLQAAGAETRCSTTSTFEAPAPKASSQRASPALEEQKRRRDGGQFEEQVLVQLRHKRAQRVARVSRHPSPEACRPQEARHSFLGRLTARQIAAGLPGFAPASPKSLRPGRHSARPHGPLAGAEERAQ